MTHKERVLEYLKRYGSISSMEAISEFGNTRLADTIFRIKKDGHRIRTESEKAKNRYGESTTFARYFYEGRDI